MIAARVIGYLAGRAIFILLAALTRSGIGDARRVHDVCFCVALAKQDGQGRSDALQGHDEHDRQQHEFFDIWRHRMKRGTISKGG